MNNCLTSPAIFGLLGAAVIALPGFVPQVAAGETSVLAKSDRLELPTAAPNCSSKSGPALTCSVSTAAGSDGSRSAPSHGAPLGKRLGDWRTGDLDDQSR